MITHTILMSGGSCGLHTVFAPDTTDDKLLSSVLHWVAENPGVRLLTLQFAGLDCAGKMAALSKRTRTSIKESNFLGLLLRTLRAIGDEQSGRDGTRSTDTVIETQLLFAARLGLEDLVSSLHSWAELVFRLLPQPLLQSYWQLTLQDLGWSGGIASLTAISLLMN